MYRIDREEQEEDEPEDCCSVGVMAPDFLHGDALDEIAPLFDPLGRVMYGKSNYCEWASEHGAALVAALAKA